MSRELPTLENTGQAYGKLQPRVASCVPWDEVAVDLVGPWTIESGGQEFVFNALMMINLFTNLVE